ncbi:MAG: cell division protein ZapA [Candidatus Cloacimonetes bacterium]|jgi:cell division protein ZapA (FtsZ GTPase activity inhibitor)|nr:cell division protein ZapA [Candidatus Cloacimonadota bacterium]MDD3143321.1 cell division protein ZapA [Candidatus Cloacimonadota bacterium]MDY0367681.1 cell division protein ZapA [Candidatus Syntrophosphaera sp.]HOY85410.1 cell division protein ZapA [Candidatus Syntrophosphaera sp.]HPH60910.1 cell division protein ZapA [Candidatus Syntrophosphaera sp.]
MKAVEVEIYGRKFRLRSDNLKETQSVAASIDAELNQLREQYENLDFTKLLLLLLLKKQDEISSLKNRSTDLEKELERLNQMVGNIVGEI